MPGISTIIEELLSFAWRHWKAILSVGVLISVLVYIGILKGEVSHYHKLSDQFAEQNRMLEATYSAAQNTARANNLEAVRKAEADGAAISEKRQHGLETQLADANARADAYLDSMRRKPAGNDKGGSGKGGIPETAGNSADPTAADRMSVVDASDVHICTKNTVVALGYQGFVRDVWARYNALTTTP